MKASQKALIVALLVAAGCSKKVQKAPEVIEEPIVKEVVKEPEPEPVVEVEEPKPVVFPISDKPIVSIYFDFDESKLKPQEAMKLDQLFKNTDKLEIHGHACVFGSSEYNMGLGQRRAETVQTYLGKGMALSFGEEMCKAKCESVSEAECEECRKVEVWAK